MYKNIAIACITLFVASASAQAASGGFCTTNADCNQKVGLCCSAFAANSTFSPYTQFNCANHVNGTATVKTQTCLANGTNGTVIDYTSVCASEAKTCINNATKYVSCGSSAAMFFIDTLNPSAVCTSASGAMSLAASAFFAVLAALALLF